MMDAELQQLLNMNKGFAPKDSTFTEGVEKQVNAREFNRQVEESGDKSGGFGRNVKAMTTDVLQDIPLNLTTLVGGALDATYKGRPIDDAISEYQGTRDAFRYGTSPFAQGVPDPVYQHNMGRDVLSYLTPAVTASAVKGLVNKTIAKSSSKKQAVARQETITDELSDMKFSGVGPALPTAAPRTSPGLSGQLDGVMSKRDSVDILKSPLTLDKSIDTVKKAKGQNIKDAVKVDVAGTLGIADLYQPDADGTFETVDNPKLQVAGEFLFNALPTVALTSAFTPKHIKNANKAVDEFNAKAAEIQGSDTLKVNIGENILAEYAKRETPQGPVENLSMKELYDSGWFGVMPGKDGSLIFSTPKAGTMMLHRADDGTFFVKKGDNNYITKDANTLTDAEGNPFISKPVQEGVEGEFGFNTLKSTEFQTRSVGDTHIMSTIEDPDLKEAMDFANTTRDLVFGSRDSKGKQPNIISAPAGLVKSRTVPKDTAVTYMGMDEITEGAMGAITDDLSKAAVASIQAIRAESKLLAGEQGLSPVINKISADVTSIVEGLRSTHGDFAEALFNKAGDNSLVPKQELQSIIDHVVRSELINTYSKLKRSGDTIYMTKEDLSGFGVNIGKSIMDWSSIRSKTGRGEQFAIELGLGLEDSLGVKKLIGKESSTVEGLTDAVVIAGAGVKEAPTGLLQMLFRRQDLSPAGVEKQAKSALDTVRKSILPLSSNTSKTKHGVQHTRPTQEQIKSGGMLDNQSQPININEPTNSMYETMSETGWYYRGTATEASKIIDTILGNDTKGIPVMSDLRIATLLEIIEPGKVKTTLEDSITRKDKLADVKSTIQEVKNELTEHRINIDAGHYTHGEGMYFPSEKVPTTRMHYTGYTAPQQGQFSKLLLGTDKKTGSTKGDQVGHYATGTRTALDEYPQVIDAMSDPDKLKFELYTKDSDGNIEFFTSETFKPDKWTAPDDLIVSTNPDGTLVTMFDMIDPAALPEHYTLDQFTGHRTIEAIKNRDRSMIIGEVDAKTSMKGIMNTLFKEVDDATGVGTAINPDAVDIYRTLGKSIESSMPYFSFARNEMKTPGQGSGYQQTPQNVAVELITTKLDTLIEEGNLASLKAFSNDLETTMLMSSNDAVSAYNKLIEKIHKLAIAKNIDPASLNLPNNIGPSMATRGRYAQLFSALDNLESTQLKIESTINTMIDEFDNIAGIRDALMHNEFTRKVREGDLSNINQFEIDAVSRSMAKAQKSAIKVGTEEAFGTNYIKLQEDLTKIFSLGYYNTKMQLKSQKMTNSLRDKIYKDLGIKKGTQEFKDINSVMIAHSSPTLDDFIELLQRYGYDTLTSRTVDDLLPKFRNPFGVALNYVVGKGSGYDSEFGTTFKSLSPINAPSPFLLHSIDSSTMGFSAADVGFINHRWDAALDSNARTIAKTNDQAMAWMMVSKEANVYQDMINSLESSKNTHHALKGTGISTDDVIRDIARRKIILSDTVPTEELINAGAKELKNEIENTAKLRRELSDQAEVIKSNTQDMRDGGSVTMQHNTDGSPQTVNTFQVSDLDKLDSKYKVVHQDVNYMESGFNYHNLKDIELEGFTVQELKQLETATLTPRFVQDVIDAKTGVKSQYSEIGDTITINGKIGDNNFFVELTHEGLHKVGIHVYTKEETASIFNGLQKDLREKGFTLGRRENGKVVQVNDFNPEDIVLKDGDLGQIDPEVLYGNEFSASMLDQLIANELVYGNRKTIASITGKKDLTGMVEPTYMLDSTGKAHELYSVGDLLTFLEGNGIDLYNTKIKEFGNRTVGLLNGSTKMKDLIFNKKPDSFTTTLNGINNNLKNLKKGIKLANEQIMEIPFLEIIQLDPTKEAILTAINKTRGMENSLTEVTLESALLWQRELEKEFSPEDAVKFGNRLGNAWTIGVNKLLYSHMNGKFDGLNFKVEDLIGAGKSGIDDLIDNRVKKFFEQVAGKHPSQDVKNLIKVLGDDIRKLADGNQGMSIEGVAAKMKKFVEQHKDPSTVGTFDHRLAVRKLASMYAIKKNRGIFDDLYEMIGTNKNLFERYMKLTNEHGNPYSLFGENIEFSMYDGTRDFKGVDTATMQKLGIADSDVVAVIKDSEGNDLHLVSYQKADQFIGNQYAEFISVDLTDFEKGFLDVGGVHVNARNVMKAGKEAVNHVDRGIVKQLSRNMWINMKEATQRDQAYRQWHMLRDGKEKVLLTESEKSMYENSARPSNFIQLSKDNPYSKLMGVRYWVDERYLKYLEDTPGLNVAKFMNNTVGNTEFAKVATQTVLTLSKYMRMLRGTILVTRASSYINSFLSSAGIAWQHSSSMRPGKHFITAHKELQGYKGLVKEFVEIYYKDQKKGLEFWNTKVKGHKIHNAMESGLVNTIRQDAYKLNTLPEYEMSAAVNRATGSNVYSKAFRGLMFDPSTPHGNAMGVVFDHTELIPKLALYLDQLESGRSSQYAVQKVIMAFPTYNNLGPLMNIVDNYVPFMKFAMSTPRMIMYGMDQNLKRSAGLFAVAKGIVPVSYMNATEADKQAYTWYMNNGFIKVPFLEWGYASMSLFPSVSMPGMNPFGQSVLDFGALYSMTKSFANAPIDPIPGTDMSK